MMRRTGAQHHGAAATFNLPLETTISPWQAIHQE